MEVGDDLNRKKLAMGRLTKANLGNNESQTAVENEFITQGVAAASRKCDEYYQNCSDQISEMTLDKIKDILGSEFSRNIKMKN